ncbi:hypothetical protein ACIOGZ_28940 [Kitasatospora sp. NPDC088160]|uniref:hypothetical protein n=1 Tax=Kitasatospora sp. NPDC088160 TaxID=3364072 RepID=UPI00381CDA27
MTPFAAHVRALLTDETTADIGAVLIELEKTVQQATPLEAIGPLNESDVLPRLMRICRPDPETHRFQGIQPGAELTAVGDLELPGRIPGSGISFPDDMLAYARSLADNVRTPRLDSLDAVEGTTVGVLLIVGCLIVGPVGRNRQRALFAVLADGTVFSIVRTQGQNALWKGRHHIATSRHDLLSALWRIGQAVRVFPTVTPLPPAHFW